MAQFTCSSCGYSREVDDNLAGKKVICPKCKTKTVIEDAVPIDEVAEETEPAPDGVLKGKIVCPYCEKQVAKNAKLIGQDVKCPGCGGQFKAEESRKNIKKANEIAMVFAGIGTILLIIIGILQMFRGLAFLDLANWL